MGKVIELRFKKNIETLSWSSIRILYLVIRITTGQHLNVLVCIHTCCTLGIAVQ